MARSDSRISDAFRSADSHHSGKSPGEARKFAETRRLASLRVLVVDDEPLLRWSIAETLAQAGYAVTTTPDAAGALKILGDVPQPDVVLLDVRLPDSRDLGLLATIRRVAPAAAVVMMTASVSPDLADDAERLGAQAVVGKPVNMSDLDAIVQDAAAAR